jgi:predicted AAA+ superfamily ATPase
LSSSAPHEKALARIAAALERLAPQSMPTVAPTKGDAFVWEPAHGGLVAIAAVASLPLRLLKGIDQARDTLVENTRRFADGLPANNALLWGARGMGKSSLVKAVHGALNADRPAETRLVLVEIHREDIASLPLLLRLLSGTRRRHLLYCDDLSFDRDDTSYKSSNRRHLMPRDMMDNERSTAINPSEAVEEKVSLSDRFGLWLGFHNCAQDDYLAMIDAYADHCGIDLAQPEMHARALAWAAARGARSGRVAWQFIQDVAGELGKRLNPSTPATDGD